MRGLAWTHVSNAIHSPARSLCQPCASIQYAIPRRRLHLSRSLLREEQPPSLPKATHSHYVWSEPQSAEKPPGDEFANGGPPAAGGTPNGTGKPVDKSSYGSALRRNTRNVKKTTSTLSLELPQRFMQKNVFLREDTITAADYDTGRIVPVYANSESRPPASSVDTSHPVPAVSVAEQKPNIAERELIEAGFLDSASQPVWKIDNRILEETELVVRANLQQRSNFWNVTRPQLVLHCPRRDGIALLDATIRHLAIANNADLIKVDAQDLASLAGDLIDEPQCPENERLRTLGYDVHTPARDSFSMPDQTMDLPGNPMIVPVTSKLVQQLADVLQNKVLGSSSQQPTTPSATKTMGYSEKEVMSGNMLTLFLETLLNACNAKRAVALAHRKGTEKEDRTNRSEDPANFDKASRLVQDIPSETSSPLIIQINDYVEILNTDSGHKLLSHLHDLINERQKGGQKIIVIGNSAAKSTELDALGTGHENPFDPFDMTSIKIITIPAIVDTITPFLQCHLRRNLKINIKHLVDMISRLTARSDPLDDRLSTTVRKLAAGFDCHERLLSDLMGKLATPDKSMMKMQNSKWSPARIHRIATVALGIKRDEPENITVEHIHRAVSIVERSDEARLVWLRDEKEQDRASKGMRKGSKENSKRQRAQLEKTCNDQEKRLLSGMVDPADIRTTFDNVHASDGTVQTLKDLTLLPLTCPQEFEYGVLAEQSLSGLLLYGPPGTGKTLLARAVAKEGGATILEVSGADLCNKYVGESEKNVKAMFSLARKLKPCIIFIDEADAILGSRNRDGNRTSHRDMINQFLHEWDGLKEVTALVMVATNRPFDLDDAVVRRLPRRILVDLPTDQDRLAILKIHLQNETLHPDVSLAKLAADTPLYSGSDLKHLVVTAAQACVREMYNSGSTTSIPSPSPSPSPKTPSPIPMPSILTPGPLSTSISPSHEPASAPSAPSSPSSAPALSSPPPPPSRSENPPNLLNPHHQALSAPSTSPPASTRTAAAPHGKRILRAHHFARAMDEISASVSEDMGSLAAIRKFDERYGDRTGRKKRGLEGGFGFRTVEEGERERLRGVGARVR